MTENERNWMKMKGSADWKDFTRLLSPRATNSLKIGVAHKSELLESWMEFPKLSTPVYTIDVLQSAS